MSARLALVLTALLIASATVPAATASVAVPANGDAPSTAETAATSSDAVIRESVTLERLPDDPGTVEVSLAYEVPDSVTELWVATPFPNYRAVSVAGTDGFEQEGPDRFAWRGFDESPTITLELDVDEGSFDERDIGVETDGWAFAYLPDPSVNWRDDGTELEFASRHTVAGDGHATRSFGVVGASSTTTRSVRDVNLTVVVVSDAKPEASVDEYASLYRLGARELESGYEYNDTAAFVLPSSAFERWSAVGTTVRQNVWVQDEYSAVDRVESTPAHEYVHTRIGTFRGESTRWLTEATAEYYGAVLSMNAGHGSWESFQESMRVERESIREGTLARPYTWSGGYVPYEKGALVLAALDAEIRNRTDGERTLMDVLEYRFRDDDSYGNLGTYEHFSSAVVAVTDDPEMRDWLGRYVAGDGVPSVPEDPDRFVLNDSMDSDGDGIENGAEASTNPFEPDTDGDGLADGEDPDPTDALRSEDAESMTTTTRPTTTRPTTTTARPATSRTTTATAATTPTAESTTTSTVPGDTSAGTAVAETDGATHTDERPAPATVRSSTVGPGGGDDGDSNATTRSAEREVPGFGLAPTLIAVAVALLLSLRRKIDD